MNLTGPMVNHVDGFNIVSDATTFGSIQVPGTCQPIILLADCQTTGGYPKIATVASCDLGRLSQIQSGQPLHFQKITTGSAESLALNAQQRLEHDIFSLEVDTRNTGLTSEYLLSVNLISGVVSASDIDAPIR